MGWVKVIKEKAEYSEGTNLNRRQRRVMFKKLCCTSRYLGNELLLWPQAMKIVCGLLVLR